MKKVSTCKNGEYKDKSSYTVYNVTGLWDRELDSFTYQKSFPALEPLYSFWKTWKENIENLSKEENDKRYVEQYYEQVLSKLDPEQVYEKICEEDTERSILICNDDITRHIIAAWLYIFLGKKINDCTVIDRIDKLDYGSCSVMGMEAEIIEMCLEGVLRKKLDMKSFHSLRALYLYNKAEEFRKKADNIEKCCEEYNFYMQYANLYYNEANSAEQEYIQEEATGYKSPAKERFFYNLRK